MKEQTYIKINPELLVWARNSHAMTRSQASEKTGIGIKRLVQLEEGEKPPTIDELTKFSNTYKRTIATLLLSKPPVEKPLPLDRRTVDSQQLGELHVKTIMAIRKARALSHSYVELRREMGVDIPKFTIFSSLKENPKILAGSIRKFLGLDEIRGIENINHVLEAYIEKVESLGVAVFQLSMPEDRLRGFSIVDEAVPIIGIKRGAESPTGKIFTLFHELGHILLNEGGLCDLSEKSKIEIEKWCNAFSAELLIPASELLQMELVSDHQRRGVKVWSKTELVALGDHFHAGPLAILRSLLENNLTTPEFYNKKHQVWKKPQFGRSKNPEGRNIAKETITEKGRAYISLAFSAFDQNRIDLKDLSDFLGIRLSYIPRTRQLMNV